MTCKTGSIGYVLFSMILLMGSGLYAQSKFHFPMRPGTVRVYDWINQPDDIRDPATSGTTVQIILKALPSEGVLSDTEDTVRLFFSSQGGWFESCLLYVNERNYLVEKYDNSEWREVLPFFPFEEDTVIYRMWHQVGGRMDSIQSYFTPPQSVELFGRKIQTYHIAGNILWNPSLTAGDEAFVADSIGVSKSIVRGCFESLTSTLTSAIIDGNVYNVQYVTRNFMPLCKTNVYQYKRRMYDPPRDSIFSVRVSDTLVGNQQYSLLSDMIVPAGWSPVLRESSTGLHFFINGKDSLVLPWTVAVGTQVGRGVVTGISDTVVGGSALKKITVQQLSEGVYDMISWIESIGVVLRWSAQNQAFRDTLMYANICGKEFGTLVGIETRTWDVIPTPALYQNVPNPFSQSTIIRYETTSSSHVRLDVFDLFGRRVATLVDRDEPPGEHTVHFVNNTRLNPGVYFYRLQTNRHHLMRKMVISH